MVVNLYEWTDDVRTPTPTLGEEFFLFIFYAKNGGGVARYKIIFPEVVEEQ